MGDEDMKTEFCNNCKKDIPSVNFVMHISHCSRNITLCDICNEPVRTSEMEEHFKEYHEMVKCICGESFEKMNLDGHKESDCKCRQVVCEFCELELPFSEMSSHKEYCGSRTELCDKCNKYIKHKDLEDHLNSDCQKELTALQNNAASHASQNRQKLPLPTMIQNVNFGDDFDRDTDDLATLIDVEHFQPQEFAPRSDQVVARGFNPQPRKTRTRDYDNSNSDITLARTLKQDQLERDELLAQFLSCEPGNYAFDKPSLGSLENQNYPFKPESSNINESTETDSVLDQTFLPCEFCGEAIKADDLIQHESGCQLTSMAGSSAGAFPSLRSQPHSLPPIDFGQYEDMAVQDNQEDDCDDTFLPCEFCQELFKSDLLFSHQSICDPQRTRPSSVAYNEFSFETGPQPRVLNNSRASKRPPRPSRPVTNDGLNEEDFDLASSTGPTMTDATAPSGNENGYFILNNRNVSYIADIFPHTSESTQKDDHVIVARGEHAHSNGSTSAIHSVKTSARKQESKKNTTSFGQKQQPEFTLPTRVEDKLPERDQRSFQTRDSPKMTSSKSRESSGSTTRSSGASDVPRKERGSERSRYADGRKSSGGLGTATSLLGSTHDTLRSTKTRSTENIGARTSRPSNDTNSTSNPQTTERRKKFAVSGQPKKKSEPFSNTPETKKQLSRLGPSSGKPQSTTDSRRKDGGQRSQQRKKTVLVGEREGGPPEKREDRTNSTGYKPRKKYV